MDLYKPIAEARERGNTEELTRLSIKRLLDVSMRARYKSFVIITGWRDDITPKECRDNNKLLTQDVRTLGAGGLRIISILENGDRIDRQDMVAGIGVSLNDAKRLRILHNQQAIIYCGPERDGINVYDSSRCIEASISSLVERYSWVTSRQYIGFDYPAQVESERILDKFFSR